MSNSNNQPRSEWARNWPVLVMGFVGVFWMSVAASPLSVLVKPIWTEWGWSRGETTLFLPINAAIILLFGAVVGATVRKFGPVKEAIISALLAALALYLIGRSGPHLMLWYAGWALFSTSIAGLPWSSRSAGWRPAMRYCPCSADTV